MNLTATAVFIFLILAWLADKTGLNFKGLYNARL